MIERLLEFTLVVGRKGFSTWWTIQLCIYCHVLHDTNRQWFSPTECRGSEHGTSACQSIIGSRKKFHLSWGEGLPGFPSRSPSLLRRNWSRNINVISVRIGFLRSTIHYLWHRLTTPKRLIGLGLSIVHFLFFLSGTEMVYQTVLCGYVYNTCVRLIVGVCGQRRCDRTINDENYFQPSTRNQTRSIDWW